VLADGTYQGDNTTCFPPTGSPTTYNAQPPNPAPIPDGPNGATVESIINVSDTFTLGRVEVRLNATHSWVGDLEVTLSRGATTFTLFRNIGGPGDGDSSNLNGLYTFSDAGATTILQAAQAVGDTVAIPAGTYRTVDSFGQATRIDPVFAGTSAAGAWTLRIKDLAAGDTGLFNGWSLFLTAAGSNPCPQQTTGQCCVGTSCSVVTATACAALSGSFTASLVACEGSPGNPISCCIANFNETGGVSTQDIFDFLSDWVSQSSGGPVIINGADINGNGVVSVQDLFDFLTLWQAGCPG
jgi:subtilisin-like proprotein convertase family protein